MSPPPRLSALTLAAAGISAYFSRLTRSRCGMPARPLTHRTMRRGCSVVPRLYRCPHTSGFHGRERPCIHRYKRATSLPAFHWPPALLPVSRIKSRHRSAVSPHREQGRTPINWLSVIPALTGGASPGISSCTAVRRGGRGPHRFPQHKSLLAISPRHLTADAPPWG